jgi:hypothetical protein
MNTLWALAIVPSMSKGAKLDSFHVQDVSRYWEPRLTLATVYHLERISYQESMRQ